MIIYLSGPITDVKDYYRTFNEAESQLIKKGFSKIINPAKLSDVLHIGATYEQFMQIDLELLSMAECICLLPGWKESKGCNREWGFAYAKDLLIVELEDLLDGKTEAN